MTLTHDQIVEEKMDRMLELMQRLLTLELYRNGVSMNLICKNLHVAKAKVVAMLKDVKVGV